jgi:F-type H+-transporting ATPase subunit b
MEVINSVLDSLGFDPIMFGAQVALFYCMHLLLTPILYRPLEKARSERDALTVGRVREAEQINREALALKAAYEDALLQARQAAQGEVQRARAEAEAAGQVRLEAARREAEAQLRAAHQEISQERARAEADLDQQVQGLSLAVAGRLVRTLASEGQGQRVVERLREAI